MASSTQVNKVQGSSNVASAKIQGAVNIISVRLPQNDVPKKYSILKFNESNNVDFTSCGQVKLERENNFKEFKSAYDLDTMPKFGAGSEFGREQKEEARKKKYGIKIRKYNPQEQPWSLKLGTGKQARRFKGIRKGGVQESASYYIFTQRPDGAFEASPVEEWYDFLPQAKYKALSAEEAEEEFTKRGKTWNHFAIMVSKRLKGADNQDGDGEDGEMSSKGKKKSSKRDKSLMLTEMDEFADSEEDNGGDDDEGNLDERDDENEGKSKKQKKKKEKKQNDESDNEAIEEQDEFDEGQEVDYISGSSSDDEQMYDETGRSERDRYEEKGVVDEDGLRKLLDSDEEDEEEAKKEEDNEEDEEGRTKEEEQDKGSESESSSDSEIDSEAENSFTSSVLMSDKKPVKKQLDETDSSNSNRPTTPTPDAQSNGKRKKPESQSPPNAAKKPKLEGAAAASQASSSSASAGTSNASSNSQSDGSIEGLVKRYLSRKPISLKDLLQKITSKFPSMPKQSVVQVVGQILQRLKPEKLKGTNTNTCKFYVSVKKDNSS